MSNDVALDRVAVHQRESAVLGQLLESLADDDWQKMSSCDRWSIADVTAHLSSGHIGRAENIGRGIRGEPPTAPPNYNMPAGGPARDQVIAERAISVEREHHGQLISYFKGGAQQLNDVLEGIAPEVLENPCWHGRGIRSVRAYIDLSIAEQAMHSWDIRSGLTADAHMNPEALPAFLDEAPRWWGNIFKPGAKLSSAIRYRFRVGEPFRRTVDVVVEGDACYVEEDASRPSDVQFDCDTETYVLMAYGRMHRKQALENARLLESEIEDSGCSALFDNWF